GEVDRPDARGLALHAAHALELVERRDARLVGHEILAGAHRLDREVGALVEHGRAGEETDRRIVEQRAPVGDARHVREALDESLERLRIAVGPVADAFAAGVQQALDLVVDVAMVEADRREAKRWVACPRHSGAPAARAIVSAIAPACSSASALSRASTMTRMTGSVP